MALKIATQPAAEPLDIDDVKLHLRVDGDDDDTLIAALITAAREHCQSFQNRAYINQTWELWLDSFPSVDHIEIPLPPLQEPVVTAGAFVVGVNYRILTVGTTDFTLIGAAANTVGTIFTATGVGAGTGTATASGVIAYYDTGNTAAYMDGSEYFVDTKSEPGRIVLNYGKSWPSTTLRPANGVCVAFTAGYGTARESVPAAVKQAMLLLITEWYENRSQILDKADPSIPHAVDSLLWTDRVF